MQLLKDGLTAYAITIRYNKKRDATEADYVHFISHMKKQGVKLHVLYYEKDETFFGVHIHGIVYMARSFFRRKLNMSGYHIKIDEIYDFAGWNKYITKGYQKKVLYDENVDALQVPQIEDPDEACEDEDHTIPNVNLFLINDLNKQDLIYANAPDFYFSSFDLYG